MLDTEHRQREIRRDVVTTSSPRSPSRRLDDTIGAVAAVAAGAAWAVFTWIAFAVQPAPDPAATPDDLAILISTAWSMVLLASIAGIVLRQRWGLAATFAGGTLMVAASLYCYATGHTGLWLATQLAAGAGLTATGALLTRYA